jgi:glutathione S-transferase
MFNTFEKRPAFESYWKRMTSRPAYARARELDDALMPPQQAAG